MDVKPNFTVENEGTISAPPKVDFNRPAATPAAPVTPAAPTTGAVPSAPKTGDSAADAQKKGN
jgi:LemA protein